MEKFVAKFCRKWIYKADDFVQTVCHCIGYYIETIKHDPCRRRLNIDLYVKRPVIMYLYIMFKFRTPKSMKLSCELSKYLSLALILIILSWSIIKQLVLEL